MKAGIVGGFWGFCPDLAAWLSGEPGRVKRCGSRGWVVGAGLGRCTGGVLSDDI